MNATSPGAPGTSRPPAAAAAGRPLSPGEYLRLRREAAGFDIDFVAMAIGAERGTAAEDLPLLRRLEADEPLPANVVEGLLGDLSRRAYRFDPYIYYALAGVAADPRSPCPPICRQCGCTWNDPCRDGSAPCAWADAAATRCTACAPKQICDAA